MMAKFTGKNLYIAFAATALSGTYRSFDESEEMGTVEQSSGADAARTYLTTLEDGTASLEFLAEADGTAVWAAVDKGTEGALEWAPEGTASGKEKNSVNAIVTSRKKAFVYDDIVKISVDFQMSGAVTESVY